jgi:quercetin dioxygenase-like cupin family protein
VTENAHGPAYLRTHQLQGAVLKFGVASEIEALQRQVPLSGTGRAAKTLVKEGPIRVTLVALRRGVVLSEHRAEGPVTIHVLHGTFRLSTASAGDTEARSGS